MKCLLDVAVVFFATWHSSIAKVKVNEREAAIISPGAIDLQGFLETRPCRHGVPYGGNVLCSAGFYPEEINKLFRRHSAQENVLIVRLLSAISARDFLCRLCCAVLA